LNPTDQTPGKREGKDRELIGIIKGGKSGCCWVGEIVPLTAKETECYHHYQPVFEESLSIFLHIVAGFEFAIELD
jgi:hypothetical protein